MPEAAGIDIARLPGFSPLILAIAAIGKGVRLDGQHQEKRDASDNKE